MTSLPPTPSPRPAGRFTVILLVMALAAAATGFFIGTASRDRASSFTAAAPVLDPAQPQSGLPKAPRYSDRPRLTIGPNANWVNDLSKLHPAPTPPPADANLIPVAAEVREQARLTRAARRAFDGAPPVVPHPIDQGSAAACIACHGQGLVIGNRAAPKMSHQPYANCIQCHVESSTTAQGLRRTMADALLNSEFQGRLSVVGTRAFSGAPPTIPHPTDMRSDCNSCHGPSGQVGLRTSHPWRQNCTQCHAPSAEVEQYPFPIPPTLASRAASNAASP